MAKHPHKLLLQQKRTWKCMKLGCSFFVHLGLAHVLLNKTAECWDCEEAFIIDEQALKEDKPRCIDCRLATIDKKIETQVQGERRTDTADETMEALRKMGIIK